MLLADLIDPGVQQGAGYAISAILGGVFGKLIGFFDDRDKRRHDFRLQTLEMNYAACAKQHDECKQQHEDSEKKRQLLEEKHDALVRKVERLHRHDRKHDDEAVIPLPISPKPPVEDKR